MPRKSNTSDKTVAKTEKAAKPAKASNTKSIKTKPSNKDAETSPVTIKKQRKPRTAKKPTSEKTSTAVVPVVTNTNTELLKIKREWISITQEITKLRNATIELEEKRVVITNKLSKLMENEDSIANEPVVEKPKENNLM